MDTNRIHTNIDAYLADLCADARYASWDYCFNYFRAHAADPPGVCDDERIEVSCLQLGFYLASWGMYRGSTDLLRHSARRLLPVVEMVASAPPPLWTLDIDGYRSGGADLILGFHASLRRVLPGATITLTTKIMLGVFGCVPAFDSRFRRGFPGGTTLSKGSLSRIATFYDEHKNDIDFYRRPTLSFVTSRETDVRYTAAKVIDMVFFIEGGRT